MTYPPQPGQPYGQDPQGQQPQQGGWDPNQQYGQPQQQGWDQTQQYQQPQQGWDPNQQYQQQPQQGWDPNQQGYQQGYGGPPAPPSKSKTGLIIGIVIGVVVLAAFGVTGFVAPGFLLSKDEPVAAPPSSSQPAPTSEPKSSPKSSTTRTPRSTESGGSSSGDPEGVKVIQEFLARISSGDRPGAIALACENRRASMGSVLDVFLPPGSTAEVKKTQGTTNLVMAEITGKVEGEDAKGTMFAQSQSGSWCVSSLLVSKAR
ncbi:Twin-arginine translocation protein TatA [Amycolatopsis sp. NPDC049868]|uniref:Twin-arginine translocation protein TatA n=1 Tax=Amycolatopsis sp. NPDC049868 TaxID=3363934 RepID=UPI003798DA24